MYTFVLESLNPIVSTISLATGSLTTATCTGNNTFAHTAMSIISFGISAAARMEECDSPNTHNFGNAAEIVINGEKVTVWEVYQGVVLCVF